jgi:SAM-dependent methyltransferase
VFTESAELYDAVYRSFKDFEAEAAAVAAIVKARHPSAHAILDIACGTAEHATYLRNAHGFSVDGLDIDPGLLAIARAKLPGSTFFESDMATFEIGRQFDVILCLFSAIGYLKTLERVTSALIRFRRHLRPGGVAIVEPWFEPGILQEGPGTERHAELGATRVTRSARIRVENRISLLDFTYRIEQFGETRVLEERHELGLFARDEMLGCFSDAGLSAEYETPGLSGRGLYIARAAVA